MDSSDQMADLRALDAVMPKNDARRRTIVSRAYHTAFLAASSADVADDAASIVRRGALHKQLMDVLTSVDDPALIRVARHLASLHAWRLIADYVLETPIPPGQETACIDHAAEIIAVVEGRTRRRAFFDTLDVTLLDLRLCASDIDDTEEKLSLLRYLVRIHLERGDAEEAREAAKLMGLAGGDGPAAHAVALSEIVARQRSMGEDISARRDLGDAVRLAHRATDDTVDVPGAVFGDVIDRLLDGDAGDYAIEVAEEIADDIDRDRALATIAKAEADAGRPEAARNAIARITDPERRQTATGPLIVGRARDGDIGTAVAEASALTDVVGRLSTLASLAEVLVDGGWTTEALDLARRVFDEHAQSSDPATHVDAVAVGLAVQIKAGDAGGAEEMAAGLSKDLISGWIFRRMTDAYIAVGDYDAAFVAAFQVETGLFRNWAYQAIVWASGDAGGFEIAEKAIEKVDTAPARVRSRLRIAECRVLSGAADEANASLDAALAEIGDYEYVADRYEQSEAVARAIIAVRGGSTVEMAVSTALAAADACRDPAARAVHLLDAAWLMAAPEAAAP
jgi:hypothetical protein